MEKDENLEGRWVKATSKLNWSTNPEGSYAKIIKHRYYDGTSGNGQIEPGGVCAIDRRIESGCLILMPKEFDPNNNEEYKKGDWIYVVKNSYHNSNSIWFNHSNIRADKVYQVEDVDYKIDSGSYTVKIDNTSYRTSAIRKALPEEIPKTVLIKGEYYSTLNTEGFVNIFICDGEGGNIHSINGRGNVFALSKMGSGELGRDYRLSTKDEKDWLDRCIKAEKFVPMENKRYYEGDIVVCINKDSLVQGERGYGWEDNLCFKANNSTHEKVVFGGFRAGGVYNEHVRPATQEEIKYYRKKGGHYYITEILKESSDEELIAYAYKHYPFGAFFKSHISDGGKIREVKAYDKDTESLEYVINTWKGEKSIYVFNGFYTTTLDDSSVCSNPMLWTKNLGWCEIVENPNKKSALPTQSEILALYPNDTKFLDLVHNKEVIVDGEELTYYEEEQNIYIKVKQPNCLGNRTCRVYNRGKWAEIINPSKDKIPKMNKEDLIIEAKRRFPIGGEYLVDQSTAWDSGSKYTIKPTRDDNYTTSDGFVHINGIGVRHNNGKWVSYEIIKVPNESTLEKWLRETKAKNLSLEDLIKLLGDVRNHPTYEKWFNDVWSQLEGRWSKDKATILWNEWNLHIKYPLTPEECYDGSTSKKVAVDDECGQYPIKIASLTKGNTLKNVERHQTPIIIIKTNNKNRKLITI